MIYCIIGFYALVWIGIAYSMITAPTDVELWGEEIE